MDPPRRDAPAEFLATHDLTKVLRRLKVSEKQLRAMRFAEMYPERPVERWPTHFPKGIPKAAVPLVGSYCALKWLILENPAPTARTREAWEWITVTWGSLFVRDAQLAVNRRRRGSQKSGARSREIGEATKKSIADAIKRIPKADRGRGLPKKIAIATGFSLGTVRRHMAKLRIG